MVGVREPEANWTRPFHSISGGSGVRLERPVRGGLDARWSAYNIGMVTSSTHIISYSPSLYDGEFLHHFHPATVSCYSPFLRVAVGCIR